MEATEKSLELMRIQTELMDQIAGVQDSIKNAVTNRQWDNFEILVESMQDYSARFEELDAERAKLFAQMTVEPVEPVVSDTPAAVSPAITEPVVSDMSATGVRHLVEQTVPDTAMPNTARPPEARLYAFASRLPETERRQFTDLYRGLRLRAMKLRAASDSLLLYLNEAKTTVDGFIDAAFPERKSKLYSRRGMQIAADMRCMVLNRIF
ncbi:MAG: hypothetical protein LBF87_02365 [Treponema sp.]|jgi:hypothetical protein|nr:hypothetical protein [Treponema sp.]